MKITVNIKVIQWHNGTMKTSTLKIIDVIFYRKVHSSQKMGVNKNNFSLARGEKPLYKKNCLASRRLI